MATNAKGYEYVTVRARRADGTITSIAFNPNAYYEFVKRYPSRRDRVNAVNLASGEYDSVPMPRPTRSAFVRLKLLS